MTAKSLLIQQYDASFDKESWYIPLTKAIAGLTAEEAAWKDRSANHSIWEIVNHLYFWNDRYYNRFKNTPLPSIEIDNNDTFENRTQADWEAITGKLTDMMTDWRAELVAADDAKFDAPAVPGREETWGSVMAEINAHTSYHTGQILYLRKQQGKWNPS
ncbi:MAG TPA: DinB family protein [Candidatus Kapabacteria bacterium]|nr:DinB family protein [Candidatus Kapabacteria bacterium]